MEELSRLMQASNLTMQDEFELIKTRRHLESCKTDDIIDTMIILYTAYLKQKHMIQHLVREQHGMDFDTKLPLFNNGDDDDDDDKELIGAAS